MTRGVVLHSHPRSGLKLIRGPSNLLYIEETLADGRKRRTGKWRSLGGALAAYRRATGDYRIQIQES